MAGQTTTTTTATTIIIIIIIIIKYLTDEITLHVAQIVKTEQLQNYVP